MTRFGQNRPRLLAASILSLSVLAAFAPGCGKKAPSLAPKAPQNDTNNNPDLAYAAGWSEIAMRANWTDTKVDVAGHFSTERNGCFKDAAGSVNLTVWNRLVTAANTAVKTTPLSEDQEYCLPVNQDKGMDGTTEIKLEDGTTKKTLFESRGDEVCTTISDRGVAENLLRSLDEVVKSAWFEDCSTAQ